MRNTADPIAFQIRRGIEIGNDGLAVSDERVSRTFDELDRRTCQAADALHRAGMRPGDRVLVNGDNSVPWVELNLACYRLGVVRVAVSSRLRPSELRWIAEDSGAQWWFTDDAWIKDHGSEWADGLVAHRVTLVGPETNSSWDTLVATGQVTNSVEFEVDPEAPAWLSYTSGTTGRPKGVIQTQRSIGAMVRNMLEQMPPLSPGDSALHTAPISHYSGVVMHGLLARGATNHLRQGFDADRVLREVRELDISVLPLVPTQISMLLDRLPRDSVLTLPSLRALPYAGSPMSLGVATRAIDQFGDVMLQFYGSTEAQLPLTALQPQDHSVTVSALAGRPRLLSAGRPTPNLELRIVNENGEALPSGSVGEIVTRGEHVTPGYWGAAPSLSSDDGWFHTRDIGLIDESGLLFLVGRKDELIISGGFNVYPAEVENVISTLEGVAEVAVVGRPSERWGQAVHAFISPHTDVNLGSSEVIALCKHHLANYKVPKDVTFLDSLPKTSTGKIAKSKLP